MNRRAALAGLAGAVLVLGACAAPSGPARITVSGAAAGGELAAAPNMMRFQQVTYVLGADLPPLDSTAPAYRASGDAGTEEAAATIAAALGLSGQPTSDSQDSPWVVGPTDGTGPMLSLARGTLGEWWYGGPSVSVCSDLTYATADGAGGPCGDAEPAADLPSDEAAVAEARRILSAAGNPVSDTFTVSRDAAGVGVEFVQTFGGVAGPLFSVVRFGADGVVESANGHVGSFEDAGEYPRVGTREGFNRLETGQTQPWAMPMPLAAMQDEAGERGQEPLPGASSDAVVPEPGIVTDEPSPLPAVPGEGPATELPVPVEPAEPEQVTVTITGVRDGLMLLYGADGSVWLVPSYVFTADDGAEYPVAAIPADLIEVADMPRMME